MLAGVGVPHFRDALLTVIIIRVDSSRLMVGTQMTVFGASFSLPAAPGGVCLLNGDRSLSLSSEAVASCPTTDLRGSPRIERGGVGKCSIETRGNWRA